MDFPIFLASITLIRSASESPDRVIFGVVVGVGFRSCWTVAAMVVLFQQQFLVDKFTLLSSQHFETVEELKLSIQTTDFTIVTWSTHTHTDDLLEQTPERGVIEDEEEEQSGGEWVRLPLAVAVWFLSSWWMRCSALLLNSNNAYTSRSLNWTWIHPFQNHHPPNSIFDIHIRY